MKKKREILTIFLICVVIGIFATTGCGPCYKCGPCYSCGQGVGSHLQMHC